MSFLTHFDFSNLGEGRKGEPLPERRVEGDPKFTTWDIEKSADGVIRIAHARLPAPAFFRHTGHTGRESKWLVVRRGHDDREYSFAARVLLVEHTNRVAK